MTWLFERELNERADLYRCDHAETTVRWSDAGYPIACCSCCHTSWRRDIMTVPAEMLGMRTVWPKPIPTFVPVELAAGWRGYA